MRTIEEVIDEILPENIGLTASEWEHIESQLRKYCEEIIDECAQIAYEEAKKQPMRAYEVSKPVMEIKKQL